MTEQNLLLVKELKVYFQEEGKRLWAANNISFSIRPAESLAIVGESGSGKSTVCLAIMRLLPNEAGIAAGRIMFQDEDLLKLSAEQLRRIRGKSIAMIFQEPSISLNPVLTIEEQLIEAMRQHLPLKKKQAHQKALEMLGKVHLSSPEQRLRSYPHQLSGGMQQRVMIAMALSCSPALLIADEPTSALDSSIEAQIINLLAEIKKEYNFSLLLVSHNLALVAQLVDNIAVMYAGSIVEQAPTEELFANPAHPYTRALLRLLAFEKKERLSRLPVIEGMIPDLLNLPDGCPFHPRCPLKVSRCTAEIPPEQWINSNHRIHCFKYN